MAISTPNLGRLRKWPFYSLNSKSGCHSDVEIQMLMFIARFPKISESVLPV